MLKADLHIHTKGDPQDLFLRYTAQDIIKVAAKQKFDVLAITWHNKICSTKPLQSYAKKHGVFLLEGTEATIDGKHTLLYNITNEEMQKVKTHQDLYDLKDHILVGAPHPFFILPVCLGSTVTEHKKLFDFIEHSHFYTERFNLNKKAVAKAKDQNIPVVANSDAHHLRLFGKDYSLLDCNPTKDAILDTLKKKAVGKNKTKVQAQTRPYKMTEFVKNGLRFVPGGVIRLITGDKEFESG
jgi:predicted metal-dependent phosphoesterase TrpH